MYLLPKLEYSYESLEPYIDAKTMEIHHSKHHQAYINNFNLVLEKHPELSDRSVEIILQELSGLKLEDKEKAFFKKQCRLYR